MSQATRDLATGDPWLARWLPLVAERSRGLAVLELGCGSGRDSAVLVAAGCRVVGVDLSAEAVERARQHVSSAEFHCQDIRAPFPVERVGVVVAHRAERQPVAAQDGERGHAGSMHDVNRGAGGGRLR